jgi:hypothetical protein
MIRCSLAPRHDLVIIGGHVPAYVLPPGFAPGSQVTTETERMVPHFLQISASFAAGAARP